MKNPTSGDLSVMINSVIAAQGSHSFIYRTWEVKTSGNPLAHTILRGATNKHGNSVPNYHYEDIQLLLEKYNETHLVNPATIIDANHSNSGKKYEQQIRIVKDVLHTRRCNKDIESLVKGVMIESYLEPGNQKIGCGNHVYGTRKVGASQPYPSGGHRTHHSAKRGDLRDDFRATIQCARMLDPVAGGIVELT